MEDVWLAAELESRWSHPLNEGWLNYFHRWTSTPSFRTWWPLLRPNFSARFRDFMKEHFDLHINEPARGEKHAGARMELKAVTAGELEGLAQTDWIRHKASAPSASSSALSYHMRMQGSSGQPLAPVQVGFLQYDF